MALVGGKGYFLLCFPIEKRALGGAGGGREEGREWMRHSGKLLLWNDLVTSGKGH